MRFEHLRTVNVDRLKEWHEDIRWSLSDWGLALAGEVGEACNVIKKIRRLDTGIKHGTTRTREELLAHLAEELADVQIYLDLVAYQVGIDLAQATVEKFNKDSDKRGFPQKL